MTARCASSLTAGLFALTTTLLGQSAYAATILATNTTTISGVDAYSSYGGGDAIVQLVNSGLDAQCPYGFWIRASDVGAKSNLAQVLAAQLAGASLIIWADTSTIWPGSLTPACLVWHIRTASG